MKEMLIKIPDEAYNLLTGKSNVENIDLYSTLIQSVQSGTLIPDNTTKGQVIETIFPDIEVIPRPLSGIVNIDLDWWNAPFNQPEVELREDVKGLLGSSFYNRYR